MPSTKRKHSQTATAEDVVRAEISAEAAAETRARTAAGESRAYAQSLQGLVEDVGASVRELIGKLGRREMEMRHSSAKTPSDPEQVCYSYTLTFEDVNGYPDPKAHIERGDTVVWRGVTGEPLLSPNIAGVRNMYAATFDYEAVRCVPLVTDRLPLYADLRFTRHEIDREPFIRELIRCEHPGLRAFEASSERLHVALERSRESACKMLVDISEHEAVGLFVEWLNSAFLVEEIMASLERNIDRRGEGLYAEVRELHVDITVRQVIEEIFRDFVHKYDLSKRDRVWAWGETGQLFPLPRFRAVEERAVVCACSGECCTHDEITYQETVLPHSVRHDPLSAVRDAIGRCRVDYEPLLELQRETRLPRPVHEPPTSRQPVSLICALDLPHGISLGSSPVSVTLVHVDGTETAIEKPSHGSHSLPVFSIEHSFKAIRVTYKKVSAGGEWGDDTQLVPETAVRVFSAADIVAAGGERVLVAPVTSFLRHRQVRISSHGQAMLNGSIVDDGDLVYIPEPLQLTALNNGG